LDKLVSVYLDGDIERENLPNKKDLLLRQKAKIEESLKDFGHRENWVRTLAEFRFVLKEAVELEKARTFSLERVFSKDRL